MRDNGALAELLASKMDGGRTRREFFELLAAVGLAAPLVGRSNYAAADSGVAALKKRLNFMDSFYTLNNDYFHQMDNGAGQAAAVLNIAESRELNNGDVNVQKGHVENAPNLGIDGITMVAATEGSEIDLLRLAGGLAATQTLGADSGEPITIGYSTYTVSNPAFAGIIQGMKDEAEKFGYKFIVAN